MIKREYGAAAVLALMLMLSVWSIRKIDDLSSNVEIALAKSQSAAEKLDFKRARSYLDEGLELWLAQESYTRIFLRQPEIEAASDAFFELRQILLQEDIPAYAAAYDKLRYHIDSINAMEHPSLDSIL